MTGKLVTGDQVINEVAMLGGWAPSGHVGQTLQILGSSSVDKVYVTAGSSVDATLMGAGVDEIYLTGRLADYAAAYSGTTITLTRQGGLPAGQAEVVKITSGSAVLTDNVYFSDGYIKTNALFNSLKAGTAVVLDSSQCTDASIAPAVLSEGADSMAGGTGNDAFMVDDAGDVVSELADEGTDTVQSYLAGYTLTANVENLALMSSLNATGTGNALNNIITGNSANNVLQGGWGNDTLTGGAGDDVMDRAGNALANTLSGNAGNNTLAGGAGGDTYAAYRSMGQDRIVENDAAPGATDVLSFGAGINADQLWFRKTGNDLEASIIGTADRFTVQDWYSGSQYHVEQIRSGDGKVLQDTQVDKLVQAMAGFAPPAMGQTSLTAAQQTALAPVLAANWS